MYTDSLRQPPTDKSMRPHQEAVKLERTATESGPGEMALVEKAARLQAIMDTTVDGIITINEQGIIQSFSKAAEHIFGYSVGEVIGRNVSMLQPSPFRVNHDAYIANYLGTGKPKIIGIGREVTGQRKDGSTFPLYLAVSEVWVGGERYFTGIVRDISEQKKASEEIKSLARFPQENPHPTLRVARDGRLLYANPTSKCLLGTWACEVGQYLPDSWREIVLESLRSGMNRETEVQCGEILYSLIVTPIANEEDVNIYGRDITERKRAEEALRFSEERHRALVQSSSDAIFMLDKGRRIISCNQAFLDLFGFEPGKVEGESVRLIHPSDESFVTFGEKAYPAIESAGWFRTEWEFIRKDGALVPTEQSLSAIRDPDGTVRGFVGVIRDITERKRAQKELEEYRDHLEQMVLERTRQLEEAHKALLHDEKLKMLGTISAEMAHEIRNPLMSIGGFARRLQKKFPDVPEIGIVVQESGRLEGILKRIENYLKPVEMRPRECSVNEITREAVELLSPELNREAVKLDLDLAPLISPAYVDPGILIQVLINVIRNAARVMDREGRITIETFESDQNIHICVRAPVHGVKIQDPEHSLLPFSEDQQDISVPVCFRLLRDMGGHLYLKQEKGAVVFAASLLKVLQPGSQAGEKST